MITRIINWFRRPYKVVDFEYDGVKCYAVLFEYDYIANRNLFAKSLAEILCLPVITREDVEEKIRKFCYTDRVDIIGVLVPRISHYIAYTSKELVCFVFGVEKKELKKALDKIVVR